MAKNSVKTRDFRPIARSPGGPRSSFALKSPLSLCDGLPGSAASLSPHKITTCLVDRWSARPRALISLGFRTISVIENPRWDASGTRWASTGLVDQGEGNRTRAGHPVDGTRWRDRGVAARSIPTLPLAGAARLRENSRNTPRTLFPIPQFWRPPSGAGRLQSPCQFKARTRAGPGAGRARVKRKSPWPPALDCYLRTPVEWSASGLPALGLLHHRHCQHPQNASAIGGECDHSECHDPSRRHFNVALNCLTMVRARSLTTPRRSPISR